MGRNGLLALIAAVVIATVCVVVLMQGDPSAYQAALDDGTAEQDDRRASLTGAATNRPLESDAPADSANESIHGMVVDAGGNPLANLRVTATYASPAWDPKDARAYHEHYGPDAAFRRSVSAVRRPSVVSEPPVGEATTDEDGTFRINNLAPGSYRVRAIVEAPLLSTYVSLTVGSTWAASMTTIRVLEGTLLRGRVVDHADLPISAVIRASWTINDSGGWRGWRSPNLRTGPDGRFTIDAVPPGTLSFRVTIDERLVLTGIQVETPADDVVVIRVPGGQGTIYGRVHDRDENAVADTDLLVQIQMKRATSTKNALNSTANSLEYAARSASDGSFRIGGLPTGTLSRIRAIAAGFIALVDEPPLAAWSGLEFENDEHEVDVTLSRGGMVHGVVRAEDDGPALADAHVQLFTATATPGTASSHSPMAVHSDRQGRFRFEGVPAGRLILIATHTTHYLPALHPAAGGSGSELMAPAPTNVSRSPPELTIVMPEDGATVERDLELRPGYTIEGVVLGPDDEPAADASVHVKGGANSNALHNWGVGFWNSLNATVKTGPDGTFAYSALPARTDWTLYAKKDGYAATYSDPVDLQATGPRPSVTLRLVPGATVRGKVRTARGDAVVGANINIWGNQSELAGGNTHTQTDDDGAYEIDGLPGGSFQMWVQSISYTTSHQHAIEDLGPGEIREGVDIEMAESVTVSGVLRDSNGDPVAHTQVGLQSDGNSIFHQASTNAKGEFTFETTPDRSSYVSVQVGGTWKRLGESFEPPATDLELTFDPPPTHMLAGRVIGPDDESVPLCVVNVTPAEGQSNTMSWSPGNSPNEVVNGVFRRSVTGNPPFTITVSAPRDREGRPLNLVGTTKRIEQLPTEPITIRLEGGEEVRGRVETADHSPVAGVTVTAGQLQTVTGADGTFAIGGVTGSVSLVFKIPAGYVQPGARTASPGTELVVSLEPGHSIQGIAFDPDGQPLDQGWVNANWTGTGSTPAGGANGSITGDGRFSLEGIPEGVLVTVTVNAGWGTNGPKFAPVTVADVRPGTDDLEVALVESVSVEGTVVDKDGKAFTQGWVFAQTPEGFQTGGYAQIQSGGTFKLQGLKPGAYKLGVHRMSGSPLSDLVDITAPATDIQIQLPEERLISGRFDTSDQLTGFSVRARAAGGSETTYGQVHEDGTWTIKGVTGKSKWIITASSREDDRYAISDPVDADARNVVLKLQRGQSITGTLDAADGSSAKQTWVLARHEHWSVWAQTDDQGTFHLRGLPPYRYELSIRSTEGPLVTLREDVEAGTEDIRLRQP